MKRAVTLIELLLVITLLSILSVMGSLFYSRFLVANQVDSLTDTVVQQLRKAQLYSMQSRKSPTTGWGVTFNGTQIVLYQGSTYADRIPTWDEKTNVTGNVSVSVFEVNFNRGNGLPLTIGTITISGLNETETVTVNSQGMVGRI